MENAQDVAHYYVLADGCFPLVTVILCSSLTSMRLGVILQPGEGNNEDRASKVAGKGRFHHGNCNSCCDGDFFSDNVTADFIRESCTKYQEVQSCKYSLDLIFPNYAVHCQTDVHAVGARKVYRKRYLRLLQ